MSAAPPDDLAERGRAIFDRLRGATASAAPEASPPDVSASAVSEQGGETEERADPPAQDPPAQDPPVLAPVGALHGRAVGVPFDDSVTGADTTDLIPAAPTSVDAPPLTLTVATLHGGAVAVPDEPDGGDETPGGTPGSPPADGTVDPTGDEAGGRGGSGDDGGAGSGDAGPGAPPGEGVVEAGAPEAGASADVAASAVGGTEPLGSAQAGQVDLSAGGDAHSAADVASAASSVVTVGLDRTTTPATAAGEPEAPVAEAAPGPGGGQPQLPTSMARPLPRVVAIANQKGGVGKTTTAVNLGAALAELDYRVLVVDLDPQGNATTGLGVNARDLQASIYDVILGDTPMEDCIEPTSLRNLFVAPATIDLAGAEIELVPAFSRELKLRRAVETVADDFDFIFIDCPPSLGLLTVNGLAAANEVVVPIQCEYYALEGLGQLLRNVGLVRTNLNPALDVSAIVLTMYDARTKLAEQVARDVRAHFGDKVCRNIVPRTVRLSEAPSFGQPVTVFDPSSRGAIAYRELAKEVSGGAPHRSR